MKSLIILLSMLIILLIWSAIVEPNILIVKRYTIEDNQLAGLKVVFGSDLHYKKYEKRRLIRDVKKINEQNADIVLLGGDYVSGHKKGSSLDTNLIAAELGKIKSKFGTFAVLGNHDGWQGAEQIKREFENKGIVVLKNSNISIDYKEKEIYIAGVEDIQTGNPDIEKTLKKTKSPIIMLSHNPDIIDNVPVNVNLLLAGHLHGGQIRIPVTGAVITPSKYGTKYASGLFNVNGKKMLVTKGIGTSILPVRFNCFPEIVVIEFVNDRQ